MSRFKAVHHCTKCEVKLTNGELMYSDGVCPYCGNSSDSTVCDYIKKSIRLPDKKWW